MRKAQALQLEPKYPMQSSEDQSMLKLVLDNRTVTPHHDQHMHSCLSMTLLMRALIPIARHLRTLRNPTD